MRIYRRDPKGPYYVAFSQAGHRVVRSSNTTDRKLAGAFAKKLFADAYNVVRLEKKPEYTFGHVVKDWLLKHQDHRKSIETMRQRIKWLNDKMQDTPLGTITRSHLESILDGQKFSNSTRNRYTAEVSKLLAHAKTLEWIDNVPSFRRYAEPKGRYRWLTKEEANKLSAELPEWLRKKFWFALATGLREGNIINLEWSDVDLSNRILWVHGDQAKAGKTFGIPLNDEAVKIIEGQKGIHDKYVFAVDGKLVTRCSGASWYSAQKRAGFSGIRFHDLRHTWASWHAMAGTPSDVLQKLGGWNTPAMVSRYSHLSQNYLSQWANNSKVNDDT